MITPNQSHPKLSPSRSIITINIHKHPRYHLTPTQNLSYAANRDLELEGYDGHDGHNEHDGHDELEVYNGHDVHNEYDGHDGHDGYSGHGGHDVLNVVDTQDVLNGLALRMFGILQHSTKAECPYG